MLALLSFLFAHRALASPSNLARRSIAGPVITSNFPDPSILQVNDTWFAYSTNSGGVTIPFATSPDLASWTVSTADALPDPGSWATGADVWAPDVIQLVSFFHVRCAGWLTRRDTARWQLFDVLYRRGDGREALYRRSDCVESGRSLRVYG